MNKTFNISILVLVYSIATAQMPDTDVWLFKLEKNKTELKLTEPKNISNRLGYDNQPKFSKDSKTIYYASVHDDKQADIYCYEISSGKTIQLTKTKESEYSPALSLDGRYLNSVVVEADSAQRIHYINPVTGISEKKLNIDSVGYFTFLNADTIIYYKLTQPHSLNAYCISTGINSWLANTPTRTFTALNRHTFIYGIKDSAKVTYYIYDFILQKSEKYANYPSTSEDAIWLEQYGLVKSQDNKLLRYDKSKKDWLLLFDLSTYGIKKITRFNFDLKNKYLVIVDNI